jgi:hypothetical protein
MSKTEKMKSYNSFSEWKKDQSIKNKKLITEVSKVIDSVAPEWETVVKWGQGCWTEGKNHKVFVHCKPDHIQLGFYAGSQLNDPQKLLQGNGKFVKHVKVFSSGDIDNKAFESLIRQLI